MGLDSSVTEQGAPSRPVDTGTILVSSTGQVKILRSRNRDDNGWNCSDGAGMSDAEIAKEYLWTAYTPDELAADLRLAAELNEVRGHRSLGGGLATWDACSGRPCVLPRLAKMVR